MKGQRAFDEMSKMVGGNIVAHVTEQLGLLDTQILDADPLSGAFLQALVIAAKGHQAVLLRGQLWRDATEHRDAVDGSSAGVMGCFMAVRTRYAMLQADRDRAVFLSNLTVDTW